MEVGEKISFSFGKVTMEGTIQKIFPKKVYIKADFKNDKGKIICRKRSQLEGGKEKKKKK